MRIIRSILIGSLLLAAISFAMSGASFAQVSVGVGISVGFPPPEIPVYEQPLCPGEGYIWTPGYWAYGDDDYYWVPGTWVLAPSPGLLWTPGYWGWGGGHYLWHAGYWGPHVGFYGGINYGFGYVGTGYLGGRWERGHFRYNRAVNNVNVTVIHNTYNTRVINRTTTRVSYNGGNGGLRVRETAAERRAERDHHVQMASVQAEHERQARSDRSQFAKENHGRPSVAATPRPGAFNDRGVVHAREGGRVNTPNNRGANASANNNVRGGRNERPNTAAPNNAHGGRADRPATATQPNTHAGNTNRPNTAAENNAARAHGNDRPANAHTVAPRNNAADRPSSTARSATPRPSNNDRPAVHNNPPRSAPQERSAPRPQAQQHTQPQQHAAPQRQAPPPQHQAPQQHNAPREQGKPQRDPHAKP